MSHRPADEIVSHAVDAIWQCALEADTIEAKSRWWDTVMSQLDGIKSLCIFWKTDDPEFREEMRDAAKFLWDIALTHRCM